MSEKKKETRQEPEKNPAVEANKEKSVRALFSETVASGLGLFEAGKSYEVPEKFFEPWEKAGLCKADK